MKKVLVIIIVGLLGVVGYLMDQNVKLKDDRLEYFMDLQNCLQELDPYDPEAEMLEDAGY